MRTATCWICSKTVMYNLQLPTKNAYILFKYVHLNMRTLIYFKAKLHVLNENENVVCFIAILTQRVYFSSRNLIGRFVGVLLKDDAEKQHIEDPSGKLHLSISCYQVKCLTH